MKHAGGRPPKYREGMKAVLFVRVPKSMLRKLDKELKPTSMKGISRADLVRYILNEYLEYQPTKLTHCSI